MHLIFNDRQNGTNLFLIIWPEILAALAYHIFEILHMGCLSKHNQSILNDPIVKVFCIIHAFRLSLLTLFNHCEVVIFLMFDK